MKRFNLKVLVSVQVVLVLFAVLVSACEPNRGRSSQQLEPSADGGEEAAGEEAGEDSEAQPVIERVVGLEPLEILQVEAGPKSVELMPGGQRLFVNDLYAHKVFIFDALDFGLEKTIALPDEPVEADFTEGGRLAWVS
ncbi:MAG: YncE family protein, partial [Actinomycetota bacterium]